MLHLIFFAIIYKIQFKSHEPDSLRNYKPQYMPINSYLYTTNKRVKPALADKTYEAQLEKVEETKFSQNKELKKKPILKTKQQETSEKISKPKSSVTQTKPRNLQSKPKKAIDTKPYNIDIRKLLEEHIS